MELELHRPVLLQETLSALACSQGGLWVDGTVGAGGHAEAILRATSPDGRLLGCDRDAEALEAARARLAGFGPRAILRHAEHARIPALLDEIGAGAVDGILLDLGVSSMQLDDPERGFSLREDGPLDMRMDRTQTTTAADLVNALSEREIASILARFGEEPRAARIARAIVRERERGPITSTGRLAAIVARAVGARPAARDRARPGRPGRIHPATRSFQALRIAVNNELEGLDRLLEESAGRLRGGGRLAVISFHSLEDRIVKRTFRSLARRCICPRDLPVCACGRPDLVRLVTPRPIRPAEDEVRRNPRSRSARLRVVERLDGRAGGGAGGGR
ncbi:MAG: 16S rRNA (cytosine(1402)-N(4))-methyltransferase RsmH [Acidobacteria bacterium]|nr:16S rRNA (cytosine(1402)-N(4))-methyltransferase RsmH [Acidobacteriota bacterium]